MSSATTTPTAAGSTSIPAPPTATEKRTVQAKPTVLTAVQQARVGVVTMPDGRPIPIVAGDWVIYRGKTPIDVTNDHGLAARYQAISPQDLTLDLPTRERLEATLGIGATQSSEALVAAVARLARIEIGTVQIPFTPGQLEEIATRAKKRGQTIGQALEAVVARIRDELFWRS